MKAKLAYGRTQLEDWKIAHLPPKNEDGNIAIELFLHVLCPGTKSIPLFLDETP